MARTASLVGQWLNTLAIVHLIGAAPRSGAVAFAVVFVLKQIPVVLLGPAAGVVADRLSRRAIMIVCDVVCAGLALTFLGVTPGEHTGLVYLLAGSQIAVATFFEPARQAAVPDLVAPRDLVAANTLASLTWSITFAVGTLAGGAVLATVGWELAMVLDALSYLVSAVFIATIRWPAGSLRARDRRGEETGEPAPDLLGLLAMREAVRYLRAHPDVAHTLSAKTVWAAFGAASLFLTLLGMDPRFHVAQSEDLGIATLWTARAVGTGIGPFLARMYTGEDLGRLRRAVVWGFVFTVVGYALVPLATTVWAVVPLVMLAHIGGAIVWVMSTVILQLTVAEHVRGRLFAAELAGVMLLGAVASLGWALVMDEAGWTLGQALWGSVTTLVLVWIPWALWGTRLARRERDGRP